jgi:hypothetical protein
MMAATVLQAFAAAGAASRSFAENCLIDLSSLLLCQVVRVCMHGAN